MPFVTSQRSRRSVVRCSLHKPVGIMERLRALLHRFEAHQSLTYFFIRVFLGFALFIRGLIFIGDQEALMNLILASGMEWALPNALIHYITLAHLGGGLMLLFGLLTRVAALAQIPILFGAVFFIHWQEGLFTAGQSLELAAMVLFLLVLVFLAGPGDLSMDHHFFGKEETPNPQEEPLRSSAPPSTPPSRPRPIHTREKQPETERVDV